MKKTLFLMLIMITLISGCRQAPAGNATQQDLPVPDSPSSTLLANPEQPTQVSEEDPGALPTQPPLETLGPDCYGLEPHPIGKSIADLYPEQADYDTVMIWFCNGFEFEDILTALQTAEDSAYTADQLLTLFENGQTWEEIWADLGIVSP